MNSLNGITTAPGAMPCARCENHELSVGRDRVDREVLDGHVVLLETGTHLTGDHHAAAHAGVAGDDHRPDVPAIQLRHVGSRSSRCWCRWEPSRGARRGGLDDRHFGATEAEQRRSNTK